MVEETKSQEGASVPLARPEELSELVFKQVVPYTLTRDLGKAIECLRHLTTDFEKEDESTLFIEPSDLMAIMELIFFKLKTCFSDDEHLFPLTSAYPDLPLT